MNRTAAIVLIVVTALFCGLPGIGSICLGTLAAMGSQMPTVLQQSNASPRDAIVGGISFICIGLVLLLIPILTGVLGFRLSQPTEPGFGEPPQA